MVTKEFPGNTPDNQVRVLSREETIEFPSDPEARFATLLSALNIGPKAVILGIMQWSNVPVNGVVSQFVSIHKDSPMRNIDYNKTVIGYCQSLQKAGLITSRYQFDDKGNQSLVSFRSAHAGIKYGLVGMAYILRFETKRNASLYPVFGSISKPSEESQSAPYTRARILEILAEKDRLITQTELMNELNLRSLPTSNLEALREAGAINYDSFSARGTGGRVTYERGEKSIAELPKSRYPELGEKVIAICLKHTKNGTEITQNSVYERLPRKYKKGKKEQALRKRISKELSRLAEHGFLKRGRFKGGKDEIYSEVELSEFGRDIVREVIAPIRRLVRDDPKTDETRVDAITEAMLNFQEYATNSARLYYPHSMGSKKLESVHNQEAIRLYVLQNPKATIPDIARGVGLNIETVRSHMTTFVNNGVFTVEKEKGVSCYSSSIA